MKHMIRFDVSGELIAKSLALPDGATIHVITPAMRRGSFEFIVEHPDLPEVDESKPIPEASPILTADHEKRPATWITFDWNLGSLRE